MDAAKGKRVSLFRARAFEARAFAQFATTGRERAEWLEVASAWETAELVGALASAEHPGIPSSALQFAVERCDELVARSGLAA